MVEPAVLMGHSPAKVDDKGRLKIPAGFRKVILRLPETGLATAEIGFLGRELRLQLFAGRSDHRRCERFRQLDLGATVRADDLRVGHGFGPVVIAPDCIGILGRADAMPRRYPRQSRRPRITAKSRALAGATSMLQTGSLMMVFFGLVFPGFISLRP